MRTRDSCSLVLFLSGLVVGASTYAAEPLFNTQEVSGFCVAQSVVSIFHRLIGCAPDLYDVAITVDRAGVATGTVISPRTKHQLTLRNSPSKIGTFCQVSTPRAGALSRPAVPSGNTVVPLTSYQGTLPAGNWTHSWKLGSEYGFVIGGAKLRSKNQTFYSHFINHFRKTQPGSSTDFSVTEPSSADPLVITNAYWSETAEDRELGFEAFTAGNGAARDEWSVDVYYCRPGADGEKCGLEAGSSDGRLVLSGSMRPYGVYPTTLDLVVRKSNATGKWTFRGLMQGSCVAGARPLGTSPTPPGRLGR